MDDANIPSLLSLPYLGLLNLPLNRYENLTKHPSARYINFYVFMRFTSFDWTSFSIALFDLLRLISIFFFLHVCVYSCIIFLSSLWTCHCRNMATDVIRPWDAVYASTRPSLLAAATNPFFFSGSAGEGVGGPHVGWNMAWPMAITVREQFVSTAFMVHSWQ